MQPARPLRAVAAVHQGAAAVCLAVTVVAEACQAVTAVAAVRRAAAAGQCWHPAQ